MSKGKQVFKRTDVTRAVQAVEDAGLEVQGVEIDTGTGKFRVLTRRAGEQAREVERNEWDEVK